MASSPAAGETPGSSKIPFWRMVAQPDAVTQEIINHPYPGAGTEEDPYVVSWIPNDPRDPMAFSAVTKWSLTFLVAVATLAVALVSSAYSGGLVEIVLYFRISEEVSLLGISLFVIGFAVGPLFWAPLSEIYGRRPVMVLSAMGLTAFTAGTAGAQNIQTLIILRFFAGSFGSAPMAVSGGVIFDTFPTISRGLASSLFAAAPFLGPTLGPIIGGFIAQAGGWRWVQGFLAAFSGALWLCLVFLLPETYAPVLLHKRAAKLSKITGKVYRSKNQIEQGTTPVSKTLGVALSRPWALLFREPIVFLLSLYMSIIYGTLYMLFMAYPIVFMEVRGWTEAISGLAFLGILVGILLSVAYSFPMYFRYKKKTLSTKGRVPPEARLPDSFLGAVALPVGLFWFAWTNYPSVHWMAPIASGVPFGFGMVMVFLPAFNYLIDSYTIYAASVLAANSAMRSVFGAVFPLFTTYMYRNLGIHWATCIPAFLALACVPMPFLFYKYGARIRKKCHYAAEADAFVERMMGAMMKQKQEEPRAAAASGDDVREKPAENEQ
ncbi:MFS transporter [Aspergillus homomorphus CBS 101889]|uniref:MFS general substrate transporter n=1 Tax=Aspergillus homomorphus (strain CBS 101889) TaxID=1450537 RepID=A0A395HZV8_ASPHC|nr:MFS general substrate transporter [Aspergillus homomorphus CBS 101889]RAL13086.1 MFS general substrate transporter [Aspergillus homomorphus CBS 101889]